MHEIRISNSKIQFRQTMRYRKVPTFDACARNDQSRSKLTRTDPVRSRRRIYHRYCYTCRRGDTEHRHRGCTTRSARRGNRVGTCKRNLCRTCCGSGRCSGTAPTNMGRTEYSSGRSTRRSSSSDSLRSTKGQNLMRTCLVSTLLVVRHIDGVAMHYTEPESTNASDGVDMPS